jgi:hypothetical protein
MTDSSSLSSCGSAVGKTSLGSGENNDNGDSGQRVMREISVGPANWSLLTKTNYTEWVLIMKIKLQVRNLWEAICDRTTSKMRGFVSQDHIGGFSMKRECANTHK